MAKRMIMMLVSLAILFGIIISWYFLKQHKIAEMIKQFQNPPITISATDAKAKQWQRTIPSVGSVTAINGVAVSPQTSGTIDSIQFESGTVVKKGDVLIHLDDRLDQATLKSYQAQYKLAKVTYDRDIDLNKKGAVSQSAVDSDLASLEEAKANVEYTQAQIDYKNVAAPFDGMIGIRDVNLGQYIQAGTTIASLQSLNPLYVNFTIPEKYFSKVKLAQQVELKTDGAPGETFTGKITAIDSEVNSSTRNISLLATLENKDLKLLPGMFADVNILLGTDENVITIPQTAVTYNLYGNSAYVLTPNGADSNGQDTYTAKLVYITVGERRNAEVEVTKGISVGDKVVSAGQLKVQNGSVVHINNDVEP